MGGQRGGEWGTCPIHKIESMNNICQIQLLVTLRKSNKMVDVDMAFRKSGFEFSWVYYLGK